jgi:hypothetical protein
MRMIPDTPHGTHSQAEKRIFDRLRAAFANERDGNYTAYHSLNLTRHAYKRFGEIDFLICCPHGIYALEVKGGRVACREGVWQYTNRYEEVTKSVEGPFKQVESALHGLMSILRDHLTCRVIDQFSIGYGVLFPDCEWLVPGAEWAPQTLADARNYKDLDRWLSGLFKYWRSTDGGNRHPNDEALKALRHYLRPEFETVIPLHVQARGAEERIATLTEDQMCMVDVVAANPRVLCSGGAGTGKTFLAMELARRWTAQGMNVALVCRSPWLKRYLEARFSIPKLTVSLAGTVQAACRRQGLEQFDALIIDEGQDLFDMGSLDRLDSVLLGGLTEGRWCFFHDINNQSGFFGSPDQDAVEYLSSLQPARVPLSTNCRNTRLILDKVQKSLGADMGTRGAGDGPKIREFRASSKAEAARLLENELIELVDHGGLTPGDVTILSPYKFEDSCVAELPENVRRQITALDEYSLKSFPNAKTSFAEIGSFKGLENEAIIVVDLPPPERSLDDLARHYVAMSRARSVLSLIQQCT